jgi:hypothetical protein
MCIRVSVRIIIYNKLTDFVELMNSIARNY